MSGLPPAPRDAVQPQPLPETWDFMTTTHIDGAKLVCVRIHGTSGVSYHFMDPDFAEKFLALKLIETARQARSGLIVAPSMPPANGIKPPR